MTRRFVSAKRLIRYFSNSSKLVEHRAQSPVREVKMLTVWPSIAEGFPTASSRVICNKKLSSTCEEFKFRGWYDAAFRLGQETHLMKPIKRDFRDSKTFARGACFRTPLKLSPSALIVSSLCKHLDCTCCRLYFLA